MNKNIYLHFSHLALKINQLLGDSGVDLSREALEAQIRFLKNELEAAQKVDVRFLTNRIDELEKSNIKLLKEAEAAKYAIQSSTFILQKIIQNTDKYIHELELGNSRPDLLRGVRYSRAVFNRHLEKLNSVYKNLIQKTGVSRGV